MLIQLVDQDSFKSVVTKSHLKFQASVSAFAGNFEKAMARDQDTEYQRVGTTALIPISGPLSYKYDFWSWYMDGQSYQGIAAKINAAMGDDSVERVVFTFDTPGGEHCGLGELADLIYSSRDRKECIAVIDPMAASAGYWLASQCSKIVSMKSGMVGSLGTQIVISSIAKYLEDEGYDMRVIRAAISPDKNIAHPYEAMKEKAVEHYQAMTDKAGNQFVDAVARGRSVSTETVLNKFGKGLMLFADDALAAGMIDRITSLSSVLSESQSSPAKRLKMRSQLSKRHL